MSNFPGSVDAFATKVDHVTPVLADDVNKLQDAVVAIESELKTPTAGLGYAVDAAVLHLAGAEAATGNKTFLGSIIEGKDFRRSAQSISETVLVSGVDATAGELVDVTLTANRVVGLPLNPAVGQELVLLVTMGGTGGYKLTYPAEIKTAWQPASAVGDISALRLRYFGTNWQQIGGQVAVSQLGVLAHRGPAVVGSLTVRDPNLSGPYSPYTIPSVATLAGEAWAPPPSGGDDTSALDTFFNAWASSLYKTKIKLYWGTYSYSGTGWNGTTYDVEGMGYDRTVVALGASSYLMASASVIASTKVKGIQFSGGLGAMKLSNLGNNVTEHHIFEDCYFNGYTQTAIGHQSSDMPYWKIVRSIFKAASSTGTLGVALAGYTDQSAIADCAFLKNAVHIKAGRGGNNLIIDRCDLLQFDAGSGAARMNIWVVPETTSVNSGSGFDVRGSKMGNENQQATDYRIVYADEAAGGDFTTNLPNLGADSTGFITNHKVHHSRISGGQSIPIIYSTTPNLYSCEYGDLDIDGTQPSYVIQYRTVPLAPDRLNNRNLFGPFNWGGASETPSIVLSNATGVGYVDDPTGVMQDNQAAVIPSGGIDRTGYVKLLPAVIRAFSLASGMTVANIADSEGGIDAAEFTATGANSNATGGGWAAVTLGDPIWFEFDLKQGSGSPMATVTVQLEYNTGTTFHFRRILTPSATWRHYRFLTAIRSTSSAPRVKFQASGVGTVDIGRVRVYHGREPQPYSVYPTTGPIVAAADLRRSRQTPTEAVLISGVDATAGEEVSVTLTAARVVGVPLNPFIGQELFFVLIQSGVGAFAVTWNAVFKVSWSDAGNATPKRSTIAFRYDGTNWNQIGAQTPYV